MAKATCDYHWVTTENAHAQAQFCKKPRGHIGKHKSRTGVEVANIRTRATTKRK